MNAKVLESSEDEYTDSENEIEGIPSHDADKCNADDCCLICLNEFEGQQIAVPETCDHVFCVDCLLQWSKVSSSCPADRISFAYFNVYKQIGGKFCRKILVKNAESVGDEEDDATLCEICGSGNNEDTLLLCDGCDLGFHCACLTPRLDSVPREEWFCNSCRPQQRPSQNRVGNERTVGRTRASEAVRDRITRNRMQQQSSSLSFDEQLDAIIDSIIAGAGSRFEVLSSATRVRTRGPSSTRRRKRITKRKTGRRKRNTQRSRSRQRRQRKQPEPSTSHGSKAEPSTPSIGPNLSMMGTTDQLDEYYANNVDDETPSYKIAERNRKLTKSALLFNKPLPSMFTNNVKSVKVKKEKTPPPVSDLLGSILGGQNLLMKPSSEVQIQKGGKLKLVKKKSYY